MRKSEKRRIGEARQAEHLAATKRANTNALDAAKARETKRKATMAAVAKKQDERMKAVIHKNGVIEAMNRLGEKASEATVSMHKMAIAMAEAEEEEEDPDARFEYEMSRKR